MDELDDRIEAAVERVLAKWGGGGLERTAPAKEWLTAAEAQSYLGVSRSTLHRERHRLVPTKRGGRLYYERARLLTYLASRGD